MKIESYVSTATTRSGYKDQLIYYYNTGVGKVSEIAGVKITTTLISTIEKRYKELGGRLPIRQNEIDDKKDIGWKQI